MVEKMAEKADAESLILKFKVETLLNQGQHTLGFLAHLDHLHQFLCSVMKQEQSLWMRMVFSSICVSIQGLAKFDCVDVV